MDRARLDAARHRTVPRDPARLAAPVARGCALVGCSSGPEALRRPRLDCAAVQAHSPRLCGHRRREARPGRRLRGAHADAARPPAHGTGCLSPAPSQHHPLPRRRESPSPLQPLRTLHLCYGRSGLRSAAASALPPPSSGVRTGAAAVL